MYWIAKIIGRLLIFSVSRDSELWEWLRIPGAIFYGEYVQSEIISIDAVNEVAECTAYPVGWASETGPLLHHTSTVPYISLLVDGLDFSCIELEGLGAFTAKYQHISVAKLNTWDGLSAHELRIVDLQLGPFLTSYRSAIVTSISITFEILAGAGIEHIDV